MTTCFLYLLDVGIAVRMALGGSAGGLVDAVCQDDLVDRVRQAVNGLGEHGVGPGVDPRDQLRDEVGGVDGDGAQHHHPGVAGYPLVLPLLVKPESPHRPVLSTEPLILQLLSLAILLHQDLLVDREPGLVGCALPDLLLQVDLLERAPLEDGPGLDILPPVNPVWRIILIRTSPNLI